MLELAGPPRRPDDRRDRPRPRRRPGAVPDRDGQTTTPEGREAALRRQTRPLRVPYSPCRSGRAGGPISWARWRRLASSPTAASCRSSTTRRRGRPAVAQFERVRAAGFVIGSRTDFAANVLVFVPIGYFLMAWLRTDCARIAGDSIVAAGVVAAGIGLSVAVEFAQIFFPPRQPSATDIVAESVGSAIGAGLWLVAGRTVTAWLRDPRPPAAIGPSVLQALLLVYVLGLALAELMPLDVTVDLGELAQKVREGRIVLSPLAFGASGAGARVGRRVGDRAVDPGRCGGDAGGPARPSPAAAVDRDCDWDDCRGARRAGAGLRLLPLRRNERCPRRRRRRRRWRRPGDGDLLIARQPSTSCTPAHRRTGWRWPAWSPGLRRWPRTTGCRSISRWRPNRSRPGSGISCRRQCPGTTSAASSMP